MEAEARNANVSSQEDTGCWSEKKSGCETGRKSTPLCGEYLVLTATLVGPFLDTLLSASDDGRKRSQLRAGPPSNRDTDMLPEGDKYGDGDALQL